MTLSWRIVILVFLLCCTLFTGAFSACCAVNVTESSAGGKTLVKLRNPFLELIFEPARGGRCVSFKFLDNNEQIISNDLQAGMFLDHWAKFVWPSGLIHLPYEYSLLNQEKGKAGIRLWITVPAKGGGKGAAEATASAQIETSPELIGLVVSKTIWLYDNSDRIDVEYSVENPTDQARSVAPYIQHNFNMGGSLESDTWYLPSAQGVQWNIQPDKVNGKVYGPNWVLDPVAGWIGVRDRKTNRGLMFAFDYNYTERIYTCGLTAEWFMESIPVAAGKSFTTHYTIKPEKSFGGFVYGSRQIVADIVAREQGKAVKVRHDIAAVTGPLGPLNVNISLRDWKSKQVYLTKPFTIPKLNTKQIRQEFSFIPKNLKGGTVIAVTVKGEGVNERYEIFYAGDKFEHDRHYNFFASGGGALAGSQGDSYKQKAPRKIKQFDKPDFATIPGPEQGKFRCMVAFGLYTQIFNFDDSLVDWKSKDGAFAEFDFINCPPNGIETFPGGYAELFAYNTVILSDVNFRALGDIRMEMLCDYVAQGGTLLVTGGPYALGNGEFEDTRFLEMLPVTLSGPFDLKWAGKGKYWKLTPASEQMPILESVSFTPAPRVYWQHFVTPKQDALVVLTAGEKPSLVLGKYGKGKVALLALSPTGAHINEKSAWWAWDGWPMLLKNVFTWLDK